MTLSIMGHLKGGKQRFLEETSLVACPSAPGRSSGCAAKLYAEGGEGLVNIALDQVSLECQLHVPVNR